MTQIIPMNPKSWWADEAIDQSTHAFAAFAAISLATVLGASFTPLAGMLLGFALGVVREVTEGGNVASDGSLTDMAFWALGGCAGAVWS